MSYVDDSLNDGESVIYRASLARAWFWWRVLLGFILLPVLGLGLLMWITLAIRVFSTEMAVTTQRVVFKTGLLSRRIDEMSLRKVESVHAIQGIVARTLGFGTVRVHGTGESNITLSDIENPLAFRKAVLQATEDRLDGAQARIPRILHRRFDGASE